MSEPERDVCGQVWAYYCQEAQSEADIIRNSFTFLLQNDSQAISFSEFRDTMLSTGNPLTEGEVRTFFSLCDDESDGILRLDEFLKVTFALHMCEYSQVNTTACLTDVTVQVLYSQPSLDVSLTRMCDTKHDRPEVIRDVSAKCSRGRPQSSASSISARSTSRPPAAAPQLKTQLREQCAVLPVDVRPPCELSQSAQSAVSQADSLGLQSTFEVLLEDSEKADYASKTTPTTNFGSTSIGHGIATESGGLKTDHSELEKIWKLKDCANTQHGGRENLAIDQQSMLTTNYGVATLCTCHGHASCGTGAGPDLIPCGSTHSSDPKFSPRETHASPGEPLLPGLTAGQPVTFSTLPSLPSEIHRKLEAMSAQTLPTLIRKGNFDSS